MPFTLGSSYYEYRISSSNTVVFILQVNVKVDYIKPPNDGFPSKTCGTIKVGGINLAEALISKGLSTALRHRQDDDQRSSCYDDLLAAETRAIKNGKGLHSKKEAPIHRVADLSGVSASQSTVYVKNRFTSIANSYCVFLFSLQEAAKAKQFLPFLQRAGRSGAIVEVSLLEQTDFCSVLSLSFFFFHFVCLVFFSCFFLYFVSVCCQWFQTQALPAQGNLPCDFLISW